MYIFGKRILSTCNPVIQKRKEKQHALFRSLEEVIKDAELKIAKYLN